MIATTAVRAKNQDGFTLIDMLFVVALIGLISVLAIPGLMRAKGVAQASSALGTIRVVNSSQLSFAITCGLGFYSPDFPTLTTKPAGAMDAFLSPDLATGATFIRSGFNFSMAGSALAGAPASCNGLPAGQASVGYAIVADPLLGGPTARYFGSNADGVIWEHSSSMALIMPESGSPSAGTALQ
jgi:prepilin-type N-terminal cleavage/methylation domain-containing protein